jgi:hypothetical protein
MDPSKRWIRRKVRLKRAHQKTNISKGYILDGRTPREK